jgi:hypothetical protein
MFDPKIFANLRWSNLSTAFIATDATAVSSRRKYSMRLDDGIGSPKLPINGVIGHVIA